MDFSYAFSLPALLSAFACSISNSEMRVDSKSKKIKDDYFSSETLKIIQETIDNIDNAVFTIPEETLKTAHAVSLYFHQQTLILADYELKYTNDFYESIEAYLD